MRTSQFLYACFQPQGLFFRVQFKLAQNIFGRESLGKARPLSTAVLFKAGRNIYSIPRIDTVSFTTEHIDEMRHSGEVEDKE